MSSLSTSYLGGGELSSCPFCGSTKVNICQTNARAIWIECENVAGCGAQTGSHNTVAGAVKRWNVRTTVVVTATIVEDDHAEFMTRDLRKSRAARGYAGT